MYTTVVKHVTNKKKIFFFYEFIDLTKHSNPNSPDFVYIQRALKCHLALAHAMNEIQ